jgi:hypothetical protein
VADAQFGHSPTSGKDSKLSLREEYSSRTSRIAADTYGSSNGLDEAGIPYDFTHAVPESATPLTAQEADATTGGVGRPYMQHPFQPMAPTNGFANQPVLKQQGPGQMGDFEQLFMDTPGADQNRVLQRSLAEYRRRQEQNADEVVGTVEGDALNADPFDFSGMGQGAGLAHQDANNHHAAPFTARAPQPQAGYGQALASVAYGAHGLAGTYGVSGPVYAQDGIARPVGSVYGRAGKVDGDGLKLPDLNPRGMGLLESELQRLRMA